MTSECESPLVEPDFDKSGFHDEWYRDRVPLIVDLRMKDPGYVWSTRFTKPNQPTKPSDNLDTEWLTFWGYKPLPEPLNEVVLRIGQASHVAVTGQHVRNLAVEVGYESADSVDVLVSAGWLRPTTTNDVYINTRRRSACDVLAAHMLLNPECEAYVAGLALPELCGWTRRPYGTIIGLPPGAAAPAVLSDFTKWRWTPKTQLLSLDGVPVWCPDSQLSFMACHPDTYMWYDIAEYLEDLCVHATLEGLVAHLETRPKKYWANTAYILEQGGRKDLASAVMAASPRKPLKSHRFGTRRDWSPFKPEWNRRYQLTDAVFPAYWEPKPVYTERQA